MGPLSILVHKSKKKGNYLPNRYIEGFHIANIVLNTLKSLCFLCENLLCIYVVNNYKKR